MKQENQRKFIRQELCQKVIPHQREELSEKNGLEEQCGEKTRAPKQEIEGVWRTNHFIEEPIFSMEMDRIDLRHTTSFEDKCMEDHGKHLLNSLREVYNGQAGHEDRIISSPSEACEQLEEFLESMCDSKKEKYILLGLFKRKTQAKVLLTYLYSNAPPSTVNAIFQILGAFLVKYDADRIDVMEENQVLSYIEEQDSRLHKEIGGILKNHNLLRSDQQEGELMFKFCQLWMEKIFLSLNGIYEKSLARRISLSEFTEDDESVPQKYVKKS